MALSFTGGDADRINHGSSAELDDISPATLLIWAWMDTITPGGNRQLCTKDGGDALRIFGGWENSGLSFWMETTRATSPVHVLAAQANFTHHAATKWCCYVFRQDLAGANGDQEILIGDLNNNPAEPSAYAFQTVGAGAITTDAANSVIGGNRSLVNISWPGDIAFLALYNSYLTDAQCIAQLRHCGSPIYPNCVLLCHYGFNGVNTQRDLSGNSNHGTVTTATVAPHVRLGPFFGWDEGLPYVVVVSGEVCWGHVTGVLEANVRAYDKNWLGTGEVQNSGDAERLALETAEYMISEVVNTGAVEVELLQNEYAVGDDVDLDYRHGATKAACLAAGWNNYTTHFTSLGYVQVRVTSTL